MGMTHQVADVAKLLNAVSTMCVAGSVVKSTAHGGTMKNLWTGAMTRFSRKIGCSRSENG